MMGDARDIARMLGEKANPKVPTRVRATVTKVETSRTWVRINGSSGETPCASTSASVKPGDAVSVLITGNRATIEGNYTSPATDDSLAREAVKTGSSAQQAADTARELADQAVADAQATHAAAERAEADANKAANAASSAATSASNAATSAASAADSAERAKVSAKSAEKSALDANWAANGALNSLGTVQDVMGTLEWLNANSIKMPAVPEKTTDTEVNPGHVYYVKAEDGTFSKVDEPNAEGLDGYYSINPGTAYFVLNDATNLYEPVEFPDFAGIAAGEYYVVDKQSTMAMFVQSHLTLTSGEKGGLYITKQKPYSKAEDGTVDVNEKWAAGDLYDFGGDTGEVALDPDNDEHKKIIGRPKHPGAAGYIKLSTSGVEIYDLYGNKVATYGPTTTIGGPGGQTTIESDVLAVGKFHTKTVDGVAQVVFDNVFSAGTGEDGKSFLRFSDGAGNDLFTVDSTGRPMFAKPVPIPSGGTNANNRGDAADNLLVQSIGGGTELTPTEAVGSVDLNSIKTPGNYVAGRSSWVASMANKPAKLNSAFRLTVWKVLGNTPGSLNNAIVAQVIREYNTGREFYRVNGGNGWTAWVCGVRDNEVIDIPHGGHGGTTIIQARDNLKLNAIRYTTTASSAGYIKVKVNSKTSWMLAFDVSLYQSYKNYVIRISGYNYSTTGTWHAPKATMVSESENEAMTVYFGHDAANELWVAFPAGDYTGVEISAVTNGYTNVLSTFALQDLFTITRVSSLTGTTDKTVAVRRPVYRGEALAVSEYGTGITSNPSMLVNLGSTSAASVFQASPRPGVTGTLGVGNGGTGVTSYSALANAIGWGNDTGWVAFFLNGTDTGYVRKIGHVVTVIVYFGGGSDYITTAGKLIATLGTAYRPTRTICSAGSTMENNCGQIQVESNGKVTCWKLGGAQSAYFGGTLTYIV